MLVTDFCAGGDAFTHIAKTGVQTEASCKVLLDGLLSALSHLGGLRILHRDVKPENLLLQTGHSEDLSFTTCRTLALHLAGGRPVLCDFGLACSESDPEDCRVCFDRLVPCGAVMTPANYQLLGNKAACGVSRVHFTRGASWICMHPQG
eukprot:g31935.t1